MKRFLFTAMLAAGLALPTATPAWAQRGGGGHGGGGGHAMGGGPAMGGGGHPFGGSMGRGPMMPGGSSFGHAVPRGTVPSVRGPYGRGYGYPYRYYPYYYRYPYYRYGYYSPWYGYYGAGFGLGLGWGWYNPYWYDGYWGYDGYGYPGYSYPGYGYPSATPYVTQPGVATGSLRLDIEPKTAEVYVDGSYAGIVDQFNGHSDQLNLTAGAHHIEVRAPGYQTLTFDTVIQADHTTDYKGHLVPVA